VVINNNKLREVYGNLGFKAGFSKADEVLATASRGIAEVITHHYTQNIDLRDAKTVLSNSGTAIMGSSTSSGKSRAQEAIMEALDSPLLNDNKITGAKNVLLLIVSGSQEITIDEIGEINDHIQNEAGHGANIIMGVGEDESLQDSISVTIIATGFDLDQQHEISNTEQKKVVHALEGDRNEDVFVKESDPAIITPDISLEHNEITTPKVVVHRLMEEEDSNDLVDDKLDTELIKTTDIIKNINIVYDEVLDDHVKDEDFVITEAPVKEEIKAVDDVLEEEQITLTFDLPLSFGASEEKEETLSKKVFTLEEDVKQVTVNDYIEVVPVTEASENGEKRYALDDFMTYESAMNDTKVNSESEIEDDIVFEKKTLENQVVQEQANDHIDPMNSPISDLLKDRADERRRKMKDFNYKFNTAKIDEIEKEPAYRRQGVNLNDAQHSSETNASRTSVSSDENDDIQLRSNNSFLHDNVD
jgi:cell division protein FtsZ